MRDLPSARRLRLILAGCLLFWPAVGLVVWEVLWLLGVRPWS